jgi:hypothetical protein
MKWVLAGILFALAVGLAIASVAIRADNVRCRRSLEVQQQAIEDRRMEAERRSVRELEKATPEQLVRALRSLLAKSERRQEQQAQAVQ